MYRLAAYGMLLNKPHFLHQQNTIIFIIEWYLIGSIYSDEYNF